MWSRSNNNLVSGRSRKNARYIGSTNRRAAPRPIGPMKLRRCPLGELVGHDLSQELADATAGLRLSGENLVEGAIDVLIHSQSHQLSHEGGWGHERLREPWEESVHAAHPFSERDPLHIIEAERPEQLMKEGACG